MVYHPDHSLVDSPANPDEFQLLPGVGEAIGKINAVGLLVVVVSNQPGVAKGKFTVDLLDAITQKMHQELEACGATVDAVFYCLHHPEAVLDGYRMRCECRKPKPGLLLRAADELGIDVQRSYMVGDAPTDVQAGAMSGCRTVWLGPGQTHMRGPGQTRMRGPGQTRMRGLMDHEGIQPDHIAAGLHEAVDLILREERDAWRSSSTRPV